MSNDQTDSVECIPRRQSTFMRRNSKLTQIIALQYSFYVDSDVIMSTDNLTNDEDCTESVYVSMTACNKNLEPDCTESVYVSMTACNKNLEPLNFEINQSIKLLIDPDYVVPSFNSNLAPLYGYRNNLTLNPLVSISSEIDANMYEHLKVKEESMHSGGVEVNVTKKDLLNMRLLRFNDFFWIIKCPDKRNNVKFFHIGDKIISVDGEELPDFNRFKEILAATNMIKLLKIRIQRLPDAKIFGVKAENYKSIFHLDEQNKFIVLNHMKDDENNKWLITEIDGENIDYICDQTTLESLLEKRNNQYVSIVLHPKDFLSNNFAARFQ